MDTAAEDLLADGRMQEALALVSSRIRGNPGDARARALLFTLLCIDGHIDRAYQQLQTWAALESTAKPRLMAYERLLSMENARQEVFTGKTPPPLRPQADPEDVNQADVLRLWFAGCAAQAVDLFQRRPTVGFSGERDGKVFKGLEDFDSRFGGLAEVFLPEGYRLIPMKEIQSIDAEPPKTFLDSIWRPVVIKTANKRVPAYLPTRYPGSERATDTAARLARKTLCDEPHPGFFIGVGQRFWLTREPEEDFGVLAFGSIHIHFGETTAV